MFFNPKNLNEAYALAKIEDDKLAMVENNKLLFCGRIANETLGPFDDMRMHLENFNYILTTLRDKFTLLY